MNIREAAEQCVFDLGNSRSKGTANTYRYAITRFLMYLDGIGVSSSSPTEVLIVDHFIGFFSAIAGDDLARRTMGVYTHGVKNFANWLFIKGLVTERSYSDSLRLKEAAKEILAKKEKPLLRTPAKGNDKKMIEAARRLDYPSPIKERNWAIVMFLSSSGCRVNEAAQLKVRDIDLQEKWAIVRGKGDIERRVLFNDEARQALIDYWAARGYRALNHPAFARHDRGTGKKIQPMTTVSFRNVVCDVAVAAGIEPHLFTPHIFRHSFAIKALRETGNLALVQDLLGHSDPASTRIYAKIYPDELREAYQKVFEK